MRQRSMKRFGRILEGSELGKGAQRHGGLSRLGAIQRVFVTVAGPQIVQRAAVLTATRSTLVIGVADPETQRKLEALEVVLLPALESRVKGCVLKRVRYNRVPRACTPLDLPGRSAGFNCSGAVHPDAREAAQGLDGELRERFVRWMTTSKELEELK